MDQRDRDPQGRARNARPRDAAGRPLPHDDDGVERVPEDYAADPATALADADAYLTRGMPFHAHEVLEAVWKAAPDDERQMWRGLAQVAVGLTHLQRGNDPGAVSLLGRGAGNAAGGPHRHGLDPDAVAVRARAVAALVPTDPVAARALGADLRLR